MQTDSGGQPLEHAKQLAGASADVRAQRVPLVEPMLSGPRLGGCDAVTVAGRLVRLA